MNTPNKQGQRIKKSGRISDADIKALESHFLQAAAQTPFTVDGSMAKIKELAESDYQVGTITTWEM